jgi:molybdopterin converting factor small subunit
MMIRVRGYLTLRKLVGDRCVEIPEGGTLTLRGFLAHLASEIGEPFTSQVFDPQTLQVQPHIAILLNGVHVSHLPSGLEEAMQDEDEVAIFPPIAGGQPLRK